MYTHHRTMVSAVAVAAAFFLLAQACVAASLSETIDSEGAVLYARLGGDWGSMDFNGDGMIDRFEAAVLGEALDRSTAALHVEATAAFEANRAMFATEPLYAAGFADVGNAIAALMTMSQSFIDHVTAFLGLTGAYHSVVAAGGEHFSPLGGLEGDHWRNDYEYRWVLSIGGGVDDYVAYAYGKYTSPDYSCLYLDVPMFDSEGASFYSLLGLDWPTADLDRNGLADRVELATLGDEICDSASPRHEAAAKAYRNNLNLYALAGEYYYGWIQTTGIEHGMAALLAVNEELSDLLQVYLGLKGSYTRMPKPNLADKIDGEGYLLYSAFGIEWETADVNENGMIDRFETALLGHSLVVSSAPLHDEATSAFAANLAAFANEPAYGPDDQGVENVVAALLTSSQSFIYRLTALLGLVGNYQPALTSAGHEHFGPLGGLEGDHWRNDYEYRWVLSTAGGVDDFVAYAFGKWTSPELAFLSLDTPLYGSEGAILYGFFGLDWATADLDANGIPDNAEATAFGDIISNSSHLEFESAATAYRNNLNLYALAGEGRYRWIRSLGAEHIVAALMAASEDLSILFQTWFGFEGTYQSISLE